MIERKEYNERYTRKINQIINNNTDLKFLKGYWSHIKLQQVNCLSSQEAYIRLIVRFMRYIQKIEPDKLEYEDYAIFMNHYEDKTISYRITIYSALKLLSEYLSVSSKYKCEDYMANVKMPKGKEYRGTKEKREHSYLTEEECYLYLNKLNSGVGSKCARSKQSTWKERDVAIIQLMLNLGLRHGAIQELDVNDIDFTNKILVAKEKEQKEREYDISNAEYLLEILQTWINRRFELLEGYEDPGALFISNKRKRIGYTTISDIVKKYAVGIKHISPHSLRRTCATNSYIDSQGDIAAIKWLLGHASTKTTELYIRGSEERGQKLIGMGRNRYEKLFV